MDISTLFTSVKLNKSEFYLNHNQSILMVGSCFSENIFDKLSDSKFTVTPNPFGIIYNPISIVSCLKRVLNKQYYNESDLAFKNLKWLSFDHHSSFSNADKEACLLNINESIQLASDNLKTTKTIFITLGSAWVYEYQNVGVVANCHKIANKQFTKRLLSVKEIIASFHAISSELSLYNVVFTVSPVRHVKDGLHENNLSKATLHLAINNLVEQNSNYSYFPAYEMIVDELRDYRYFKDDLVHPTLLAINYVWDKFKDTYCNSETIELISQIDKIKAAANHKPFDFKSEAHQQFIKKQKQLIKKLNTQYSFLDFETELRLLGSSSSSSSLNSEEKN